VELVMEGPDEEMQQVIEAVQERMSEYIAHVNHTEFPATGEFAHFSIRHC
jgi:acylphosphatase